MFKFIYPYLFFPLVMFPNELNRHSDNKIIHSEYDPIKYENVQLLAKLINSESESENFLDKLMVGSTVLNRMRKENKEMDCVIYEKNMFSGVYGKRFLVTDESLLAAAFLSTYGPIDTSVIYFLNPKIATNRAWVNVVMNRPLILQNTNHFFYK